MVWWFLGFPLPGKQRAQKSGCDVQSRESMCRLGTLDEPAVLAQHQIGSQGSQCFRAVPLPGKPSQAYGVRPTFLGLFELALMETINHQVNGLSLRGELLWRHPFFGFLLPFHLCPLMLSSGCPVSVLASVRFPGPEAGLGYDLGPLRGAALAPWTCGH